MHRSIRTILRDILCRYTCPRSPGWDSSVNAASMSLIWWRTLMNSRCPCLRFPAPLLRLGPDFDGHGSITMVHALGSTGWTLGGSSTPFAPTTATSSVHLRHIFNGWQFRFARLRVFAEAIPKPGPKPFHPVTTSTPICGPTLPSFSKGLARRRRPEGGASLPSRQLRLRPLDYSPM